MPIQRNDIVSNPTSIDVDLNYLKEILNHCDIGIEGKVSFNDDADGYDKMQNEVNKLRKHKLEIVKHRIDALLRNRG